MRIRLPILFLLTLVCAWLLAALPAYAQKSKSKKRKPPTPTAPISRKILTLADSLVLQARALSDKRQEALALEKCRLALRNNPVQYEALWRASVLSSRIGARYSDEIRQTDYFENARAYASRALEIHPDFATANYAMALAIASLGTLSPLRGRLSARLEEKPYLDAALQNEPHHADAWQLMGRWQFKVANYTIFETLASRLLLGSIPHEASNQKAYDAMRHAIDDNPQRLDYYYDLARMYQLKGKRELAIQVLLQAQNVELITTEDLAISRQAEALLTQLQRRRKMKGPELEIR